MFAIAEEALEEREVQENRIEVILASLDSERQSKREEEVRWKEEFRHHP